MGANRICIVDSRCALNMAEALPSSFRLVVNLFSLTTFRGCPLHYYGGKMVYGRF